MKQYQVIAGFCPCEPQRTMLKHGEVKPADFFEQGQADALVARKLLKEIEPAADATKKAAPAKKAAASKKDATTNPDDENLD